MTTRSIQIELPEILLSRAKVEAIDDVRELVTFLLENYVQELEKAQRDQAYARYYTERSPEEIAEEQAILDEFAYADTELIGEMNP